MKVFLTPVSAIVLCLCLAACGAKDNILPEKSGVAQAASGVNELFEKLGDEDFKVRQQATKDLDALVQENPSLAPRLRSLWQASTDPEVRTRLGKVLKNLPIKEWRFSKTAVANKEWEWDQRGAPKFEYLDEHTLRIDTAGTPADFLRLRLRLPVTNAVHRMVMAFDLKVEKQQGDHPTHSGVMANIEDDNHQAWAFFWQQRVGTLIRPQTIKHDFTDFTKAFVPVRLKTSGENYRVFIDGKKVLETLFGNYRNPDGPCSWAVFGDSTRGSSGRSVWRNVRVQLYER